MSKVIIIYYSRTGNTKSMAELIEKEINEQGVDVDCKPVDQVKIEELVSYDGIIIGSPTYYGSMAGEIKILLDKSVKLHGKLTGKLGGAFTSSANIGGGNETTILDILKAFLIHGMVIQGDYRGDHYGPVAIGKLDSRSSSQCRNFSSNYCRLLNKLIERI